MKRSRTHIGSEELVTKGFLKKTLETALRPIVDKLSDHEVRLCHIEENMATKDQLNKLIEKVSDHEFELVQINRKLENMATKDQLDQVIKNMDFVMRTIKKFDDERTFNGHRIGMLEETSKVHSHDIGVLKLKVGI